MAYRDFTLETVESQLGIRTHRSDLFEDCPAIAPTPWLEKTMSLITPLSFLNEKSRGEMIVSPILMTATRLGENRLALLSGGSLDIDPEAGLAGVCDFLLWRGPALPPMRAPIVLTVTQAKNADVEEGLGQGIAQMVGARRFNQKWNEASPVFGCVTCGEAWQFIRLDADRAVFHSRRFYKSELPLILRALLAIQATALAAPQGTASP